MQLKRPLLSLGALALVVAACGSSDRPAICDSLTDLAVVNGTPVTCDDLYELRPDYSEAEITVNGEMVRGDLTRLIQTEVFVTTAAQEFGVDVSDEAIASRLANPPDRWLATLDPARPAGELRLDAVTSLIRDAVVPELIAAEFGGLDVYAAQRPQEVVQVCARVIVLETEASAIDAINRLDAGDDFEDLQRELSIDQSSDGLITVDGECPIGVAGLGEEFALAAALAPLDEPAGPIPLGGFFTVLRVEDRRGPDSSTDLEADFLDLLDPAAQSTIFSPWASDALREADIDVASPIGRWSPAAFAIAPPGFNPPRG